jgi:hypothetical protein
MRGASGPFGRAAQSRAAAAAAAACAAGPYHPFPSRPHTSGTP